MSAQVELCVREGMHDFIMFIHYMGLCACACVCVCECICVCSKIYCQGVKEVKVTVAGEQWGSVFGFGEQ